MNNHNNSENNNKQVEERLPKRHHTPKQANKENNVEAQNRGIQYRPIEVRCVGSLGSRERLRMKIIESQRRRSLQVNWSALV